jgi:enterochelin esterase-like enzyme
MVQPMKLIPRPFWSFIMLNKLCLVAALSCTSLQAQPLPSVASGQIERLANFASRYVDARNVDIWLPDGYPSKQRYQVLYMHDGQMLFDAATTWNKQAWEVDRTLSRLMKDGRIEPTIVVGIWNNGKFRHSEYFPQKHLQYMTPAQQEVFTRDALQGKARADNYLRFLVEELKPAIDKKYATRPEAASTFVMGSSMGGLISVYAMNEYPEVFGGAAGLSTHWVGKHTPNTAIPLAAYNYLSQHLADPKNHRLYQDHGTTELDALYAPYQVFVDELAKDRGYTNANYLSKVFEGKGHNEVAWAARLEVPVLFLMGK